MYLSVRCKPLAKIKILSTNLSKRTDGIIARLLPLLSRLFNKQPEICNYFILEQ